MRVNLFTSVISLSLILLGCGESAPGTTSHSATEVTTSNSEQPTSSHTSQKQEGRQEFETVTDVNERSFTIEMPKNWKNEAFLVRTYQLVRPVSTSTSPDNKTVLFIGDARMPSYMVPTELVTQYMEIATANPLMKVAAYQEAEPYFVDYVKSKFSGMPGFQLGKVGKSSRFRKIMEDAQNRGGRYFPVSDVSIEFSFKENNRQKNVLINGTTTLAGTVWICEVNGVMTEGDPADFTTLLLDMVNSQKTDPAWKDAEERKHQQKMAQLQQDYYNQQVNFQAMNQQHQLRMQNMQSSFNAHNRSWQQQQTANDISHEKFLNLIRGEHTVSDQSGNTFQVNNSHQKYFVNKITKTYIGTHSTTSLDDLRNVAGVNPEEYEEATIIR